MFQIFFEADKNESYPILQKKSIEYERLNNVSQTADQVYGRSDPALPANSCLLTWNYQVLACNSDGIITKYHIWSIILPQSTQLSALLLSPPWHPWLRGEYELVCMKVSLKYDFTVKFLS